MAEVRWIKITTTMFDDEKIDFIESLPDADTILIIWIKLLVLAGKCNANGHIFLTETIPYNEDMLAHKFNRPLNTVKLALETFVRLGMVEIIEGRVYIKNWEKHQNIEGLEKIREQTRKRVSSFREKQKQLPECNVTSNVTVTHGNAIDLDLELDLDLKKNKYIVELIVYLNQKAETNYKTTTKSTRRLINARINEGFTEDDFRTVIDKKVSEWRGTDMAKFLRPETLFGTKFEGYLNQSTNNGQPKGGPRGSKQNTAISQDFFGRPKPRTTAPEV